MVPAADFRLLEGEDSLTDYQFGNNIIHHLFCKNCGVKTFGQLEMPALGGTFYAVSVPCLDDATTQSWSHAPITFQDGRNNDYDNPPDDTRYL